MRQPLTTTIEDVRVHRIRRAGIVLAVVLAAIAAWAGRYEMTHDGISYLDMSRAVLRHDWARAINGHWSPLYPWLLALVLRIVNPGPRWAFPTVHAVNLALFLATLACFDFFLRQLLIYRGTRTRAAAGRGHAPVPDWVVVAVGYVIFVWSSLNLIGLAFVAPDFAVATCVYLAAGWLLRCRLDPQRWASFAVLGLVLGLGYLAKAPMFPLGFVFLALTVVPIPRGLSVKAAVLRAAVTLVVFLCIAGTLVVAFYETKGRLTLGDSAWLNYLWHVNRLPILHYQGEFGRFGTPLHPTRRIFDKPAAYEFAGPVEATYPPWFDPAYWYAGLRPHFDPKGHLTTLRWSLKLYDADDALHHWMPSAAVGLLAVGFLLAQRWVSREMLGQYAIVWVPGLAAFAAFGSLHLESRYVAPFMTLLWLGLTTAVRLPTQRERLKSAAVVLAVALMFHAAVVIGTTVQHGDSIRRDALARGDAPPVDVSWRVASALRQMGVEPGDQVAIIGPGLRAAYWAWLARVRIIAEVPAWGSNDFWTGDEHARRTILERFAQAGATIVVTQPNFRAEPQDHNVDYAGMGWQRVGDTNYFALRLRK